MPVINIPDVGKFGVIKDQPPQELPINAWSDAKNMRFREQGAERFRGQRRVFDLATVVPYWIQQYNNGGKRWWIHAGTNALFADDGVNPRENITPTVAPTGGVDDRWTGGFFNGVFVANNGVDAPLYWGGTGVMTPLPNWTAGLTTKSLRAYKNSLVAAGINRSGTDLPHTVLWSSLTDPGAVPVSWDINDPTKEAGEFPLAEDPSPIVDQLTMGDANIIYKEQSMWSMTPSGDNQIYRFQRLPGDVGALVRGGIANTPAGHVVLTPGDVILHAGQGPQSIITSVMRRWLFNQVDSPNRLRSFVVTNPPANEVWVCFTSIGEDFATTAAVWNWRDNTWAIRELPGVTYGASGQIDYSIISTWEAQSDVWRDAQNAWNQEELSAAQSRLLMCGLNQAITAVDVSASFDGQPFTSQMTRIGLALDAPDRVKTVRSVFPRVEATTGTRIRIEVGSSMDVEGAVTWSPPVEYVVGSTYKADAFASGRFLAARFTSMDNNSWRIKSYGLDVVTAGEY